MLAFSGLRLFPPKLTDKFLFSQACNISRQKVVCISRKE